MKYLTDYFDYIMYYQLILRLVNSSKSVRPVDALRPVCFVNFNKILCAVNYN